MVPKIHLSAGQKPGTTKEEKYVQFCGSYFFKVDNFEEYLQVYIELMMDDYPN